MLTDQEVLEALHAHYDQDALPPVLNRLLRVPEAWAALHDPSFLSEVNGSNPTDDLAPSHLAALALGGSLHSEMRPKLKEAHDERSRQVWEEASIGVVVQHDLRDVALLGMEFGSRFEADAEPLFESFKESPGSWRSALAVAWPSYSAQDRLIAGLLAHDQSRIVVQVLLANYPEAEAAARLSGEIRPAVIQEVMRNGETGLARALPQMATAGSDKLSSLLVDAMAQQTEGDQIAARGSLHQAWELASRSAAHVADFTAAQACSSGDPVTELEASRKALELMPTPVRRARAAMSLIRMERSGEALALVSGTDPAIEELIAGGLAESRSSNSGPRLKRALSSADGSLDDEWFGLLVDGLTDAEEWGAAVEAVLARTTHHPASAVGRIAAARVLLKAGDQDAAAEHAAIGLALIPDSEGAIRLNAEIQTEIGNHSKAFDHWSQVSSLSEHELAQYAIAANKYEYAASLLDGLPSDSRKTLLEGKILEANGAHGQAADKYRESIRKQHGQLDAYEALASIQEEIGENADTYTTLSEAVQANPGNPSARLSLSRYLSAAGKTSLALDEAAAAWELDEANVSVGLTYADLLIKLGHADRALEILRQAALRQPLSWRVGLALAKAYERRGDFALAAQALKPLPDAASPSSRFDTARIWLNAGVNSAVAVQQLEAAKSAGISEPSFEYWYGLALEEEGRFDEAIAQYEQVHDYEHREQGVLGAVRGALALEQTSRALAALEDGQVEFPKSARILAAMSEVYLAASLPEKSLEVAEQAVELDHEETRAWQALGDSLAHVGDFRGAVGAIEKLSALDPEATAGWLTLARLASGARDQQLARRAVAEGLWRGRRKPEVLRNAAEFMNQSGNSRTAANIMKAATRIRPNDPQLIRELAMIQESGGLYDEAFESWQACLELAPNEPETLRRSALCVEKLGRGRQSVQLLEKAVTVEPGNHGMRRELALAHLAHGSVREGLRAYAGAVKAAPNDSALAFEAAETALCSGDPRYALALLSKMGIAQAESGRSHAATGEAFLLLDKPERASTTLTAATELGYETVRTLSILSLATSDRSRAYEHLARARSMRVETAHDAIWLARAEVRFLNAVEALDVLAGWGGSTFAAQEQVRVALRSRDMLRLFDLSDAVSTPTEDELMSIARSTLKDLDERDVVDPSLEAWLRLDEAPSELDSHIDAHPLGWIGEAQVIAHIRGDRLDSAAASLERARLARSSPDWGSILEGLIHEAADRPDEARAAFRLGLSSNSISGYLLGRAYERTGDLKRAARHVGNAVVESPEQHRWQHRLATVYMQLGDGDSALAHFQEAASRDAKNPAYLLSLAAAYAESGHLNQAFEGYTAALAHGSDSESAYRAAGQVALELGAHEQASAWFERAITMSPTDIDSLIGSAKAAIAQGDKAQADERLRTAIRHAPHDPRVLLGVGQVRMGHGDYRAALSAFEEALEAGADPSDVRRGESAVLIKQGKHVQATEAIQEVLQASPDDHRLWHELAMTFEAGSDLQEADRAVNEALRISPANPEYRLSLGRISRKSGNLDRAVEELRQAETVDPEDPRIPIEAGLVYEDRREFTRALDSYLKAVEIDPASLQAHYRAGLLLRTLKAYRKSGEMLKRAAELAPTDQDVMHQLAAVRALELVHG